MNATASLPTTLVLYDGECGVCDATVQFILARDPGGRFHFAALQGETAARIVARHPELPTDLDSLILVEQTGEGEQLTWWSHATFGIATGLGGPYTAVGWLRFLPKGLTDWGYKRFAELRLRVMGKLDHCRIPKPEEAARFLP